MSFGTSNGDIWGTPDTVTPTTTYTVYANNSAGSSSTTITFTVNDVAPSITFGVSGLSLYTGQAITPVGVSNSGGAIVSCNIAPSLPTGLALSSGCVLSGTPSIVASNTTYTITANNTGGSDTATFALLVRASGGSLALSSAHREGSVNSSLQNITMSYTHSISNYGWTSGVTNTSSIPESSTNPIAGTSLVMWDNGDRAIAWTRQVSGSPVLALSVQSGGTWSTQNLDTASSTGYRPSMAIDGNGALHIAYLDRDNTRLRYATNASGSWAFSTLDESSVNPANDGTRTDLAIDASAHPHHPSRAGLRCLGPQSHHESFRQLGEHHHHGHDRGRRMRVHSHRR